MTPVTDVPGPTDHSRGIEARRFPAGPDRTTSPEDFDSIMADPQARVFDRLPDETWVSPGHGRDTTLGAERPALPEWRARGW